MPYKEKVPDTLPWLLVLALQLNDLGVNIALLSADQAAGSLRACLISWLSIARPASHAQASHSQAVESSCSCLIQLCQMSQAMQRMCLICMCQRYEDVASSNM
jgi:hypothetical protein